MAEYIVGDKQDGLLLIVEIGDKTYLINKDLSKVYEDIVGLPEVTDTEVIVEVKKLAEELLNGTK